MPNMDARSLRLVLSGEALAHRTVVTSALDAWRMVWDG